jgi:Putative esterase
MQLNTAEEESCSMISTRIRVALGLALGFAFASFSALPLFANSAKGRLVDRELQSKNFEGNKVGTSPVRKMIVYLPAGYDDSSKHYPVIYFLPSPFENYRLAFDQRDAQGLLDRATGTGMIDKFILVCVDMTTPLGSSWYVNSPVTGNWEDFMIQELVPYIDVNFRTLPHRDSRGIAGDFMGGYWRNPFRQPPLFIDLQAHKVGNQLVIDSKVTERLRDNFLLESMIPQDADNLKSLRGSSLTGHAAIRTSIMCTPTRRSPTSSTSSGLLTKPKSTTGPGERESGVRMVASTRRFYHSSRGIWCSKATITTEDEAASRSA